MRRQLGARIALVVVVIAVSVWYLYPPAKTINLGLDLQGGIHLVLGVDVDKAVEAQVERAGDTAKAELEKRGIGVTRIERRGTAELVVQLGLPAELGRGGEDDRRGPGHLRPEGSRSGRRPHGAGAQGERGQAHPRPGGAPGARDHPQPRRPVRRGRAVHPAAGRQPHPGAAPGRAGSRAGQGAHRQDRAARVQAGGRAHRRGDRAADRAAARAPRSSTSAGSTSRPARSGRCRSSSRRRRRSPGAT